MPLSFGIPTLDELIEVPGSDEPGDPDPPKSDASSLSLLGPDGSGKSVLALHIASRYRASCCEEVEKQALPKILYISSDLQFESARKVWFSFKLNEPFVRDVPFERIEAEIARRYQRHDGQTPEPTPRAGKVVLKELTPIDDVNDATSVAKFLLDPECPEDDETFVGFLDLARHTAGDDWNFVNSLIVNLQACSRPSASGVGKQDLSHLVIIDSVAGFETFMGTLDAYGMEQSRRARIAQSMRNAQPHAHLVFVVEEPDEGKRLPEEYVTDVVVRLRTKREGARPVRTLEVEKARARNHASGEHIFEIRNLKGSSSGSWENPDTPAVDNNYVHVFHSLSHRNHRVSTKVGSGKAIRKGTVVSTGLSFLDNLLEPEETGKNERDIAWGFRSGTTAALIGDTGTGKSVLAESFLAHGFTKLAEHALGLFLLLEGKSTFADSAETLGFVWTRLCEPVYESEPMAPRPAPATYGADQPALLSTLATAWSTGQTTSADHLARMPPRLNPATRNFDPGSVEYRVAVLGSQQDDDDLPHSRVLAQANPFIDPSLGAAKRVVALFRHPNLRAPAVLLTTSDRTSELMAQRCLGYLTGMIDKRLHEDLDPVCARQAVTMLLKIIEEQLIVRRVDIDNVPGSALYDMAQRNVIHAQYMIHGPYFPADQVMRHKRADRIRVVIDDMRVLSNLCPAVSADPAFLPYLVFDLEREGVTTLIVHTDDLRPGARPTDPVSERLISLLHQIVLTWSAPFEGQSRIAISAIPATSKETNGIVREVEVNRRPERKWYMQGVVSAELARADVTRHLELYADLDSGRPRLVPLAIYLFGATKACRRYMDQEDVLYRKQFMPVPGLARNGEIGRVFWPIDATEYFAIRDLTHLPWDVKADHTIIDQVDGFWSLDYETGTLASQRAYLTKPHRSLHEDPSSVFHGEPLWSEGKEKPPCARKRYFKNSNYESRIFGFGDDPAESAPQGGTVHKPLSEMPDRVPFTWDFSFVQAPVDPWDKAAPREIRTFESEATRRPWEATVGAVRCELAKPWQSRRLVTWRSFLGACKEVADQARQERGVNPVPFDFAATSAETLLSMVLEIWFSEISQLVLDPIQFGPDNRAFPEAWRKWRDRLEAKTYRPLPSLSTEAGWYSMSRLLKKDFEGKTVTSIEHAFRTFRCRYLEDAIGFCDQPGRETHKVALARWLTHLQNGAGRNESPDRGDFETTLIEEAIHWYESDPRHTVASRRQRFATLPPAAVCLYKTWLLLQDVFDFEATLDPSSAFETKQPKTASSSAMAVRHYYRTACDEQSELSNDKRVNYVLAMPGCFSVRGDSFLASAQASRSQLLAANAIDLLCSRRANLTRMQMGIGLPVRDVLRDEQCREMRTALRAYRNRRLDELKYAELCEMGGPSPDLENASGSGPKAGGDADDRSNRTQWLFRNGMPDYDRTSRAMQKWLTRLFRWTIDYRARHVLGWEGGFRTYDALAVGRFAPLASYTSFDDFAKLCDYLVAEVEAAERSRP